MPFLPVPAWFVGSGSQLDVHAGITESVVPGRSTPAPTPSRRWRRSTSEKGPPSSSATASQSASSPPKTSPPSPRSARPEAALGAPLPWLSRSRHRSGGEWTYTRFDPGSTQTVDAPRFVVRTLVAPSSGRAELYRSRQTGHRRSWATRSRLFEISSVRSVPASAAPAASELPESPPPGAAVPVASSEPLATAGERWAAWTATSTAVSSRGVGFPVTVRPSRPSRAVPSRGDLPAPSSSPLPAGWASPAMLTAG